MKKNRKTIFVKATILFLLAFPTHFLFEWFPSQITAIFFPVNESLMEHLKMIFTNYFIFYSFLFILRKPLKLNNVYLTMLIGSCLNILLFFALYLPIYYRFGEHLLVTLLLYFLTILFTEWLVCPILHKKEKKELEITSIIVIPLLFFILAYFTFNPLKNPFFFDPIKEDYGLNQGLSSK